MPGGDGGWALMEVAVVEVARTDPLGLGAWAALRLRGGGGVNGG